MPTFGQRQQLSRQLWGSGRDWRTECEAAIADRQRHAAGQLEPPADAAANQRAGLLDVLERQRGAVAAGQLREGPPQRRTLKRRV
jgi:hypothetical protein